MQNNDLEKDLIEKSVLIMKGVTSLQEINRILGIEDSTSEKWLELAEENIEPYKSYAEELKLFLEKNGLNYDSIVENDFKIFKDNELDFLLEDNYLFSLENTREDKISILKTRVHPENLRDSIENLKKQTSKLDDVFNLLMQLDESALIGLLDDGNFESKSKEEITDMIISDLRLKNIDKLIMNLESYLSDLNEFNITSQLSENNVLKSVDGDNVLKVVSEDNALEVVSEDNVLETVSDEKVLKAVSEGNVLEADDNKAIEDDLGNDSLNEGNFESFVDGMMNDFLNALKEGKSEEEAMDISGVNSITLMSWKIMAESGDETFKKFHDEYMNLMKNN